MKDDDIKMAYNKNICLVFIIDIYYYRYNLINYVL
tara:strand:+ start:685 stop:789 length:105 start_codon:yes stop_codon:yes gene_type:complete